MGFRQEVKIASRLSNSSKHQPLVTVVKKGAGYAVEAWTPSDKLGPVQSWRMQTLQLVSSSKLATYVEFTMPLDGRIVALTRPGPNAPVTVAPYIGADVRQRWFTLAAEDMWTQSVGDPADLMCLDLHDAKTADGTPLYAHKLNEPSKRANQSWHILHVENLPGAAMPQQVDIAAKVLRAAAQDRQMKATLVADPAHTFVEAGYPLQIDDYQDFNRFFREQKDLMAALQGDLALEDLGSFSCTACRIGGYALAATLVAIGAAGIALLAPETPIVVSLAAFAGVSEAATLVFLKTVVATGVFTFNSVLTSICAWVNVC